MDNWQAAGFGLYVHWPFCEAKCPYCDFNSHVSDNVDHMRWRNALVTDLRTQAQAAPDRTLSSIFFGGGTPSRMHPETVAAVVEEARRLWPSVNDLEVTLEANPTSVEAAKFAGFANAGVNRVSIGLQALRDTDLRALGRTHSVEQALSALEIARSQFERVSFDVIYARQGQTMRDWDEELHEIIELRPDHVSLYQLTIEPGTVFARRAKAGKLSGLPDEDVSTDMYLLTNDILTNADLPAYETSNYAASTSTSRHNLIYWRGGDWLGIGPGAHGRYGKKAERIATEAIRMPSAWLDAVEVHATGLSEKTAQPPDGHAEEYLLTSIRLSEGLNFMRLCDLGLSLDPGSIADLLAEGLVVQTGETLCTTAKGRALADGIGHYLAARAVPAVVKESQS